MTQASTQHCATTLTYNLMAINNHACRHSFVTAISLSYHPATSSFLHFNQPGCHNFLWVIPSFTCHAPYRLYIANHIVINCIGIDALKTIYHSILSQHISMNGFHGQVQKCTEKVVTCALQLHQKVASTFLPTAIKFHYIFNLRDLSNIFQGLLFSTSECIKTPLDFARLWLHEASRVYGDKFVDERDMEVFDSMKNKVAREVFDVRLTLIKLHRLDRR